MSEKVILWRRAGARRADIRRICLTEPQADIAGEMRDAGCESKLQTANCKQDRSMSCVVPPSKRASIGQPNHSKRASRSESLSFAFSSLPVFTSSRLPVFPSSRLPVFPSSRLHVFTSSRLHVFTSSRFRDFEISKLHAARTVLESLERFNSPAHSPIRSHRPRCPSCAYRQALSAPGRPASAAWRRRIAQRPSGASAPKPLRRATPHARLSRARGRRRDCARPPSPDRAPDRPPRRSRRYAARTRRPDATPRRRR
ncbi:Uncharacterised protein [Burkholderia pseudomallei]|nr:Uncharacterised protein [Burkholderia pseudomallei]CAJ4278953.1 Uncharacterised protein [Burkholderia pseudomallei]CAJ9465669.1 Uncharacterised protein [Burkholderia pseudomallei]VBJ24432.1 Uncharacterised protein [Burkholderia pseudomallei]VBO62723.1 Uncharacterised protein [Burkholderia pseudomallei]